MTDFPVAKNSYVAFDGLTIKEKIRERLNQTGIFTDQNFEGSNLAGINDAFAMSFSLLLYYVNQQSVNGSFSVTNLYENMNRIVKEIGYSPIGYQTASVNFSLSAGDFAPGFYTIPRYSSLDVAGISFSLNTDLRFTKTSNIQEEIGGIESNETLYQGRFIEYPLITPSGNSNETIVLTVDDDTLIDNFNIDIYVKTDGHWKQWKRTQSLYLNSYNDLCYEVRFNENKRYEIKFGDDINGKKLLSTDSVAIYYLSTDGKDGEIGAGALNNKKINPSLTTQLSEILNDILTENESLLNTSYFSKLSFNNKYPSTIFNEHEDVESIRKNAPSVFRSQFSLTTNKSYETYIRSNFSNIIHDIKVKNNKDYIDSYIKYFYNLGLTKPQYESRALFNQVEFSDSCGFNNIYLFIVPKSFEYGNICLTPTQKHTIIDNIQNSKVLTSDVIPMDPVYLAFDLPTKTSKIGIKTIPNNRRSETSIVQDVSNIITSFFSPSNNVLGNIINLVQLETSILDISGVDKVFIVDNDVSSQGIHMICWNPVYPDISVEDVGTRKQLEDFQFPYLNDKNIKDRIVIL
jgi:hypothetical protein